MAGRMRPGKRLGRTSRVANMPVTIGTPTEAIKPFFDGPTNDTKNHVLTIGPVDSMCGTLAVKASVPLMRSLVFSTVILLTR